MPVSRFEAIRQACERLAHGVRGRYVAGCRCMLCRAANSRYCCEAQRRRDAGDGGEIIPADAARQHLLELARSGVGYKAVASACDVADSILFAIRSGSRKRIRKTTEARILAVDRAAIADGARVPAAATWRLLNELIQAGYTKRQLAQWLGAQGPALQVGKRLVTARTASRVERMYRLVQEGKLRRP
jgi:hypothetical protein